MSTRHPFRIGIQTGQQNYTWSQLSELWQKFDRWGYDSLWNFDHFYPIFTDPTGPCLEGWTTLTALSQVAPTARIGHLVNGNSYRNPCLLAKMAVSLDHISNGRLNLGIGAGWFEHEHRSLGFEFKPVRERLEALDEACRIIKGMMRGDSVTLEGKHYTVRDAMAVPGPVQAGGPPIMIGGAGRNVLLRIVAQWADMWNYFGSPADMADLVGVIRRHADKIGRDSDEIEKTVAMPLCYSVDADRQATVCQMLAHTYQMSPEQARGRIMIGSRDECLERIDEYRKIGISHFIFMQFGPVFEDEVQAFAEEVAPAARAA
ncbi:MAG TPA: TIGR03560 family F420-dependent LLM class oxidoreductase [Candidatus Limnocylindrales bacterium]|nr:TIGR03560 family F420-dependent LLM class oxidoreductase [Candidatus Limnocylindrales bacterium]